MWGEFVRGLLFLYNLILLVSLVMVFAPIQLAILLSLRLYNRIGMRPRWLGWLCFGFSLGIILVRYNQTSSLFSFLHLEALGLFIYGWLAFGRTEPEILPCDCARRHPHPELKLPGLGFNAWSVVLGYLFFILINSSSISTSLYLLQAIADLNLTELGESLRYFVLTSAYILLALIIRGGHLQKRKLSWLEFFRLSWAGWLWKPSPS